MVAPGTLNERAMRLADHMANTAAGLRLAVHTTSAGARLIDCGIEARGGLAAGLALARVCLAGQAEVGLLPGEIDGVACPMVQVMSDHPVLACMAAQYAGWQIKVGKFSAMGSGPMRTAYGKEELFDHLPGHESTPVAVGVLETRQLPDDAVIDFLQERLQLPADRITLLAAPTFSMAGNLQVVARSLETALHKLYELQFDLAQVVSGMGTAPLPPVAGEWLGAIGRTNDAILYGGRVVLWVHADDAQLAALGPKVPSSSSPHYGAPFTEIFARCHQDFYQIDPTLFSPAEIVFHNLKTGHTHPFGKTAPDILRQSFFAGR